MAGEHHEDRRREAINVRFTRFFCLQRIEKRSLDATLERL